MGSAAEEGAADNADGRGAADGPSELGCGVYLVSWGMETDPGPLQSPKAGVSP
jgi:hypothetical protein